MTAGDEGIVTECSRCGDCCDPVGFNVEANRQLLERNAAGPDPNLDPGAWVAVGWRQEDIAKAKRNWDDANFILEHWTASDAPENATCDRFDPVARLCTAHEDRPPVCRHFPWYGDGPNEASFRKLSPRCSFRSDWSDAEMSR